MKVVKGPSPERTPRPVPIQEAVRDTLSDLLMKVCSVSKAEDTKVALMGVFRDAAGMPTAAVAGDWFFCAFSAAALAMVPPRTAMEQAEAGELDETLHECFYEVANVLSRLFNGESVSHLRLTELVDASSPIVADFQKGKSRHLDVLIESYGTGRIGLYTLG